MIRIRAISLVLKAKRKVVQVETKLMPAAANSLNSDLQEPVLLPSPPEG
jgi:hypothetical protein